MTVPIDNENFTAEELLKVEREIANINTIGLEQLMDLRAMLEHGIKNQRFKTGELITENTSDE